MLLLRPEMLSSAILFCAVVPFVPKTVPDLTKKSSGLYDPIVKDNGSLLASAVVYWQ
jgi:hypothetical protein